MEIIITEWGLQSYIDLKSKNIFSEADYRSIIRPDAELLKRYPTPIQFSNSKFWGRATSNGITMQFGFKMKWRNLGPGKVQLRLPVAIVETEIDGAIKERAFLCNSYVKDDKAEKREMAKFKIKIQKILEGNYYYRGSL